MSENPEQYVELEGQPGSTVAWTQVKDVGGEILVTQRRDVKYPDRSAVEINKVFLDHNALAYLAGLYEHRIDQQRDQEERDGLEVVSGDGSGTPLPAIDQEPTERQSRPDRRQNTRRRQTVRRRESLGMRARQHRTEDEQARVSNYKGRRDVRGRRVGERNQPGDDI